MFSVRCPECNELNHRDGPTFPFCGRCHHDLARCAYCRHHEGNGCRHPRAYVRYTPDGDAAKQCRDFASSHEVRGSRLVVGLPAPLWVSILLLLILGSMALAGWFIDPAGRYFFGSPLRVETAVPQQVLAGEPFKVDLLITNLLDHPSAHVTLDIDSAFLADVDWQLPDPRPERLEADRTRLLLEYEPLPRGAQRHLMLYFTPRRDGVVTFGARIYAPGNQLRSRIAAPIQVVPNPRMFTP